jgi:hypothetical protein
MQIVCFDGNGEFSDKNGKYSRLSHRQIENKSSECRVYGVYGLLWYALCPIKSEIDLWTDRDKTMAATDTNVQMQKGNNRFDSKKWKWGSSRLVNRCQFSSLIGNGAFTLIECLQ